MKRAVVFSSLAVASIAGAQEWRFELSDPVLSPATASTFVTLSIDPGPADYAFAAANLKVNATEAGWSDLIALLSLSPPFPPHQGQRPGTISGGEVTGVSIGQLAQFGWEPTPGRIDVWRGTFTATDFTPRDIGLSTETTRFDVYTAPPPSSAHAPRTPIEGRGEIVIVPAPAGLALLGVGGVALARRRRPAGSLCRRDWR
jgi:hypothetical protein